MRVCVVIPTHKSHLTKIEQKTVFNCINKLICEDIYIVTPPNVANVDFNDNNRISCICEDAWDNGTYVEYNKMCLTPDFYKKFIAYDYMLICQTDAYVLGNEQDLNYFINLGFDYYGAAWEGGAFLRQGFPEYYIDTLKIKLGISKYVKVGNGGFSLRNIKSTINILEKYKKKMNKWFHDYRNEDVILAYLAVYDPKNYKACPMNVAKDFSTENALIKGQSLPFGIHGSDLVESYMNNAKIYVDENDNKLQ